MHGRLDISPYRTCLDLSYSYHFQTRKIQCLIYFATFNCAILRIVDHCLSNGKGRISCFSVGQIIVHNNDNTYGNISFPHYVDHIANNKMCTCKLIHVVILTYLFPVQGLCLDVSNAYHFHATSTCGQAPRLTITFKHQNCLLYFATFNFSILRIVDHCLSSVKAKIYFFGVGTGLSFNPHTNGFVHLDGIRSSRCIFAVATY